MPHHTNTHTAVYKLSLRDVSNYKKKTVRELEPPLNHSSWVLSLHVSTEFAHSHYLKLVGTIVEKGTLTGNDIISYQYTATHNGEAVKNHLPEVRISYDISPTVVRIHNNSQRWYEFLTKLCAIVGGFFTVMSLVDSGINNILQRSKKDSMGKLS